MNAPQRGLFSFDDIKFMLYESSIRPRWRSPSARRSRCTNGALVAAARYVDIDLATDRERQVGGRARGSVPRAGENECSWSFRPQTCAGNSRSGH